jgi:hypothetical protein
MKSKIKNFTGYRWWEQKNKLYREDCFKKSLEETIELKGNYDYFIKKTNKIES